MASDTEVNITNTLRKPQGNFEVTVHDKEFPTESFTSAEAKLFEQQLNDLVAEMDSSVLANILLQRQDIVAKAAAFAKQDLEGKVFGGINAGDSEIGFSVLRPGHIRADPADGTPENDWYFEPTAQGWNDWVGDGAGNDYAVSEDQVSVVLAFVDQDVNSEVSGLNVDNWGRNMDMLPHDLNDLRMGDNERGVMVKALPTLIAREGNSIHARLRYDRIAESQPRLFGLTFGVGSFLNAEDY